MSNWVIDYWWLMSKTVIKMDQNTIATADQEGLERKRLLEEKKRKIEELRRKKQSNVENERREKEIRRNRDSSLLFQLLF